MEMERPFERLTKISNSSEKRSMVIHRDGVFKATSRQKVQTWLNLMLVSRADFPSSSSWLACVVWSAQASSNINCRSSGARLPAVESGMREDGHGESNTEDGWWRISFGSRSSGLGEARSSLSWRPIVGTV